MVNTPLVNHWWNVPLYVTARGLDHFSHPPSAGPELPDRLRLDGPQARDRDRCGKPALLPAGVAAGRRFLRRADEPPRTAGRGHSDLAHARRDLRGHPVSGRSGAHDLRPRAGAPFLVDPRPGATGVRGLPQPLFGQSQPGPPVLGRLGPGRHALFGPVGASASSVQRPIAGRRSCSRPIRTR